MSPVMAVFSITYQSPGKLHNNSSQRHTTVHIPKGLVEQPKFHAHICVGRFLFLYESDEYAGQ